MDNVQQATRLLRKALFHIHAAKSKNPSFKKGDRVAIYWIDEKVPSDTGNYLATVTMVRQGMVYLEWDAGGAKWKLPPKSKHFVGIAIPRKIKKMIPNDQIHFYITEWINKPSDAAGEVGEKRKRTSRKNNAENIAEIAVLEPQTPEQEQEIEQLMDESAEIDEMLEAPVSEKQIETIDERIERITNTILELDEELKGLKEEKENNPPSKQLKSVAARSRAARRLKIKQDRERRKNNSKVEPEEKYESLTSSNEKLEVGKSYQMIGSKRKLGKFYHDPFFKVLGANKKDNDFLYAIEYKNGTEKGKILGSNLPNVIER